MLLGVGSFRDWRASAQALWGPGTRGREEGGRRWVQIGCRCRYGFILSIRNDDGARSPASQEMCKETTMFQVAMNFIRDNEIRPKMNVGILVALL